MALLPLIKKIHERESDSVNPARRASQATAGILLQLSGKRTNNFIVLITEIQPQIN